MDDDAVNNTREEYEEPNLDRDMSRAALDLALRELTRSARQELGAKPSRSWSGLAIEVDGLACDLDFELSAWCTSLDDPGYPSGWRFCLEWSCVAHVSVPNHGGQFSAERSGKSVQFDPHAKMECGRGESLIYSAVEAAMSRLRHHQGFASWKEAAAIEAELGEINRAESSMDGAHLSGPKRL